MNGLEAASDILFYHFWDKIPATTVSYFTHGKLIVIRLTRSFNWSSCYKHNT